MSQDLLRQRQGVSFEDPSAHHRSETAIRRALVDQVRLHPGGIPWTELSRYLEARYYPPIVRQQYWQLLSDYEIHRTPDGLVKFTAMGRVKHVGE